MILEPIELKLDKNQFTISCITGKSYNSNIGNFARHLKKYNLDIVSYTMKYYSDYLPICIESGNISNNKITGYWNRWVPLKTQYKNLGRKCKCLENTILRIKEKEFQYFTKFITFDYWLLDGNSLSYAYEKINYFINTHRDMKLYRRLSNNFYDNTWNEEHKVKYMQSILDMKAESLKSILSYTGLKQRGITDMTSLEKYYQKRFTIFRNIEFQTEMAQRSAENFKRKNNHWCIEYWLNKGYSLLESKEKISMIQDYTSINSIKNRYKCSELEAREIQFEIYHKRKITMNNKSKEELQRIYKKQDSSSMEYCFRKTNFNYNLASILYDELKVKRIVPLGRASKESLKYFIPLYKYLRRKGIKRSDIYIGVKGSRKYFINNNSQFFMYDFTIESKKIIIEYDGIYWHEVNSEKDIMKTQAAVKRGFKLMRIRSDETNKLTKMKIFINENL